MGMKFRKSIKLGGGTKLNLSKSGIGVSTGVKGFRVSKNTSGRSRVTASLPGTGLSYVNEFGGTGRSAGDSTPSSGTGSGSSGKGPKKNRGKLIGSLVMILLVLVLIGLVRSCVRKIGDFLTPSDDKPAVVQQEEQEPPEDAASQEDKQDAEPEPSAVTAATKPVQEQPQAQEPPEEQPQQEQPQEPKQKQPVQQEEFKDEDSIVYITPDGKKYHKKGCRTLKVEPTEININDAIAQGRTACKVCGG